MTEWESYLLSLTIKELQLDQMKLPGVKFKKTQQKEIFFPTWAPITLQNSLSKDTVDRKGLPKLNY